MASLPRSVSSFIDRAAVPPGARTTPSAEPLRSRRVLAACGLAVLLTAALPGWAIAQQASPPSVDLSIDRTQRRPVVLPKPNAEQIRSDAEAAVDDYVAGRSMGRVVRETAPVRPPARPDLDDDVTGGIQTQRLNDALRQR